MTIIIKISTGICGGLDYGGEKKRNERGKTCHIFNFKKYFNPIYNRVSVK